ncbi:MAG: diguanylate cyclase [Candidatus Thiodiazotropha sp. (ex Ctena orbiculata)]|uniref:diguanylate cyclase n=1 Tax=Candidatus Thiodiazotropha taylori TaxID=2792791 RepID=A0A944M7Q3_9GAMM|nr:diguanylate cyclase [Candidatus Thiodiazotropha taylori]MBT3028219.1 diguanylate cyclase [Candidatus Thiodiazotropha taylori]MBT3036051.1 diguanylate cyclase [Candidatus Thiodiazotropha taylori]MBV2137931.1 diguanylate cyclase [Candidatus Thiodiazotropha taylori]
MNSIVNELKLESNNLINQITKQISLAFIEIHSDLLYVIEQQELRDLDSVFTSQSALLSLQESWKSLALQRRRYDQIRFLDISGKERIRINYNNGDPIVIGEEYLQSKKSRYYFTESINKQPGTIYSSPLDLNIENQQIELPLKPMIRFASPVVDSDNQTIGVIILNYLAENILNDFRRVSAGYSGEAILLNWQGYTLLSPESAQDWGFMFPDSPQVGINVQHADIWQTIQQLYQGQVVNRQGLYTFDSIHPSGEKLSDYCTSCLRILLYVPTELINSRLWRQLTNTVYILCSTLVIVFVVLAMAFWNKEKRKINERQIQHLNQQISTEHDLFLNGPSIIAKLRNELGWPVEFISANVQELLGYEPEAFTNGSLSFSNIIDPGYLQHYFRENVQAEQDRAINFKRSPYKIVDRDKKRKWVQDTTHLIRDEVGRLTHFFVHISDISHLKEVEEKLTDSHNYIQRVVDAIADPTLVIDINNHQLQLVNQSALSLYTNEIQLKEGMTCYRLSHKRNTPCSGKHDPCPITEIQKTKKSVSVVHKHYNSQGKVMYVDVRATPIFDDSGEHVVQIIESHRDITDTINMEKQLQYIAETDRLTQIYNRTKFDEELKNQIAWASLTNNRFGLIMLDLDHFKQVNDNFGHDVGDAVLKKTVELLHTRIRKSDILARWGGEEFMIIAPDIDQSDLLSMIESLRSSIENIEHEGVGRVTASFGASIITHNDNIQSLLKRVDMALYRSKHSGRNRCTIL